MRRQKIAPVTVYRPDAAGALAVAEVVRPVAPQSAPRAGAVFGIWHDWTESWTIGPATLEVAAEYACLHGLDGEILFYGAGRPGRLNGAERAIVRLLMQEGAE